MKLLFCRRCGDVRKIQRRPTSCECGLVTARLAADEKHVEVTESCDVLGIGNDDLRRAVEAARVNANSHEPLSVVVFSRIHPSRVTWLAVG